ncbi:MAG TPA: helix-turn-helix domain-containing protein [Candidatus Angelobacter sp.]|nr:helix-turn-helix domain-containing protein [Candidatus Angelobacter sp.]
MSCPEPPEARLRADAARNRAALLGAARRVYAERGLDAPLDEIAREAGVGNATLYRHFPGRCALAGAVFAEALQQVIDAAEAALADPDPWQGFARHVTFLCRLQATDRAVADLMTTEMGGAPDLEALRDRAQQGFVRLAERARAAGALRQDFVPEDLVLVLMANAGVVHRTAAAAPEAWNRFVDLVLDGLRSGSSTRAAAPCPGADSVRRAMAQRGEVLGYS